jgi:hypothetical protein
LIELHYSSEILIKVCFSWLSTKTVFADLILFNIIMIITNK